MSLRRDTDPSLRRARIGRSAMAASVLGADRADPRFKGDGLRSSYVPRRAPITDDGCRAALRLQPPASEGARFASGTRCRWRRSAAVPPTCEAPGQVFGAAEL